MSRLELSEQEMENVVGGAFTFYEDENGNYMCHIDDYGTVYASANAKRQITKLYLANKGCSVAELVQLGIDQGLFSENQPF